MTEFMLQQMEQSLLQIEGQWAQAALYDYSGGFAQSVLRSLVELLIQHLYVAGGLTDVQKQRVEVLLQRCNYYIAVDFR